ncbi:hypothetical protein [Thiomonas sp.]
MPLPPNHPKIVFAEQDLVDQLPGIEAWVCDTFELEGGILLTDESRIGDFISLWEIDEDPSRWNRIRREWADQGVPIERRDLVTDVYRRVLAAKPRQ